MTSGVQPVRSPVARPTTSRSRFQASLAAIPTTLTQQMFDRRTGQLAGVIYLKKFEVKKGRDVVMRAVDHEHRVVPDLEEWRSLRIYPWGRIVAQISGANHKLEWLLELGDE